MMVMMSVQGPYRSDIGLINKSQKGEEEAEQHSFFYLEPASFIGYVGNYSLPLLVVPYSILYCQYHGIPIVWIDQKAS